MTTFLSYTVIGIATGCIYALTASGLVVTYTTSGIFNIAHGAIGMVMAFAYWELTVNHGWNQILGLVVVLGIFAPLLGALIERVLMRGLHGSTIAIQLVITLGLLLALLGLAQWYWDPTEPRILPEFFVGNQVGIFDVNITYHQLTMVAVAILVAAFLRLLFTRTRIGIAMRAVVDDPELASLNGADPGRVAAASWAIGAMLAGLSGILLAPLVTIDAILLTLLVINGYAAAMVGRLRNLPATFLGGLALGLAETFAIGELPTDLTNKIRPALPIIFLFIVLLLMPQARLRAGRLITVRRTPRVSGPKESLVGVGVFVVLAVIVSNFLGASDLTTVGQGLVFSMIMLSLVMLTGYAGQTSLAQMTFVGLGAFAMGKWFGGDSILGFVAAALLAGAVGGLAALPALRLTGLYLALSTLAFAQAMTVIFFRQEYAFGYGGRLAVGRPDILGISTDGDQAFFIFTAICLALMGAFVVWVRRGPFGRRLMAMKDSPAACATLGLNLTFTKLAVFAMASAIAGVAGCFYGGLRGQVGSDDFEMFQSLVVLLLVSISGINTVIGAIAGGLTFALFTPLERHFKSITSLKYILVGLGAVGIGRNPNGWTSDLAPLGAAFRRIFRLEDRGDGSTPDGEPGAGAPAPEEVRELAGSTAS